jgi:hypothetical protein
MTTNQPYGYCLLKRNSENRDYTSTATYGNGIDYPDCVQKLQDPLNQIGPQNTSSVNSMDQFFLRGNIMGTPQYTEKFYSATDLQNVRPTNESNYIQLASNSLHVSPDQTMNVFFSDQNINHLRNTVVSKVKQITADSGIAGDSVGVTIKTPNMDDMFYYMINIYQTYKVSNGSICFVNLKNTTTIESEISKLNTDLLQDYISKMVSQINMYIYYYKDASQLPQQLSLPALTTMKGSKTLEYNTGFTSGNSRGVASYNLVGNL